MSHHPGCAKASNDRTACLYGVCTCAAIEQREHTEALNNLARATDEASERTAIAHTEFIATLEGQADLKRDAVRYRTIRKVATLALIDALVAPAHYALVDATQVDEAVDAAIAVQGGRP